jgi:hypothetical protein
MGRPLNPRYWGPPTASGSEIKVNFNAGSGVKEGYIVKQKGSKRFVVEEIGTAGEHTCTLAWEDVPANLASGEMSISFKMDDGETYLASKIAGRKVTLSAPTATGSNAYDGKSVAWNFDADLTDGAAQAEEAGDDNVLVGTDDDDFTEDA